MSSGHFSGGGGGGEETGIPQNRLDAHYLFDGDCNDAVGDHDFGTIVGTPTYANNIVTFSGGAYAGTGNFGGLVEYEGGVLSLWVKDPTSSRRFFSIGGSATANAPAMSIMGDGATTAEIYERGGGGNVDFAVPDSSAWHHIIVVMNNYDIQIYVNGALAYKRSRYSLGGGSGTYGNMYLATGYLGAGNVKISQMRLYNRGAELPNVNPNFVARLYAEGAPE